MPAGLLALVAALVMLLLLPFLLADVMVAALLDLGIAPGFATLLVIGIFLGSLFNVPVWHRRSARLLEYRPYDFFGIDRLAPRLEQAGVRQVVALNVGGCIIPALIVVYELLRLLAAGGATPLLASGVIAVNVAACYLLARPVAGLGILLPALVPASLAALMSVLLVREHAPVVAFCAGVLGPLLGADLLHIRDLGRRGTGLMSIGGAGTFDGIVISGFLATMLSA